MGSLRWNEVGGRSHSAILLATGVVLALLVAMLLVGVWGTGARSDNAQLQRNRGASSFMESMSLDLADEDSNERTDLTINSEGKSWGNGEVPKRVHGNQSVARHKGPGGEVHSRKSAQQATRRGWAEHTEGGLADLELEWSADVANASLVYDARADLLFVQPEGLPVLVYSSCGEYKSTLVIEARWRLIGTVWPSTSAESAGQDGGPGLVMVGRVGSIGAYRMHLAVFSLDGVEVWAVERPGIGAIRIQDLNLDGKEEILLGVNGYGLKSGEQGSMLVVYGHNGAALWEVSGFDGAIDGLVAAEFRPGRGLECAVVLEDGRVIVTEKNGSMEEIVHSGGFDTSVIELLGGDAGSGVLFLTLGYRTNGMPRLGDQGVFAVRAKSGAVVWELTSGALERSISSWRGKNYLGDAENPLPPNDASIAMSPCRRWAAIPTGGGIGRRGVCLINLVDQIVESCTEWDGVSDMGYRRWGNLVWVMSGDEPLLVVSTGEDIAAFRVP